MSHGGGAPRGRPDLAGCLSRCVRTDRRVEVCAKSVPTLVEPRTFVQWVLKEQHSHQTFDQWRLQQSDDQSGLPSIALDHVSATERSPMSPPRPWVSVGTIHGQNASGWHPATGGVERAIRQLIIGISHRIGASWPSEPSRDAQYYHGTTQTQPRASWCVTHTDTQAITPLRRCRLDLSLSPSRLLSAFFTRVSRVHADRAPSHDTRAACRSPNSADGSHLTSPLLLPLAVYQNPDGGVARLADVAFGANNWPKGWP